MKRFGLIALVAIFSSLASMDPAAAQGLRTAYVGLVSITPSNGPILAAADGGYFKKYGLDVELIHIPSSSRGIQAILAGEIAFSFMDGSNAAQANLKGANLALVAGATNRQVFSLMAKPDIKRIVDLKGKKIGITRVGSSTHTSALYALGSAGLRPADYQLLPLLEVPNIFTALSAGQIDAGAAAERADGVVVADASEVVRPREQLPQRSGGRLTPLRLRAMQRGSASFGKVCV